MGMSVSAASAIMFTTFVILFGVVFGAIDHFQSSVINAQQQNLDREQQIRDMSIDIVSVNATSGLIVLLNNGSTTILLDDVDLLLNGTFIETSSYTTQVDGHANTNMWAPQETLTMQMTADLTGMRIMVTVNGWATDFATG